MKVGQRHKKETREGISEKLKGKHSSPDTEFKKGCIPWNKGLKRRWMKYAYHNNSETKFKKGHQPKNWKPTGTIILRRDNRKKLVRCIKVGEPNKWEYYSRYIWMETRKREIPKGFIVYHKDGNGLNDDPKNLVCITRSLLAIFLGINNKKFRARR